MPIKHIVSVSGGKDSTALLILAVIERCLPVEAVFADTEHEHPLTYEYLEYLDANVHPIRRVKANFTAQIARKREYIASKWANDGVPDERIRQALDVLRPTGNLFLDLCMWKGRFPSTRARFCSQHLKHEPIREQVLEPLLMDGYSVWSWQGVRADESRSRANLPIIEEPEEGLTVWRPIIRWSAEQVFAYHRKHGIKWNPLYEQGMGRVGCMPCIHATKRELRTIANRYPDVIDHLAWMEKQVSIASKRGCSTFYDVHALGYQDGDTVHHTTHGIRQAVEWSRTAHGGKQQDFLNRPGDELEMCSSIYGLCETAE